MSAFEKYINCQNNGGIDTETLLRSIFVQHTDGTVGIRTVRRAVTECDDLTQRVLCTHPGITLDEMLRESIVLDPCGQPALMLFDTVGGS